MGQYGAVIGGVVGAVVGFFAGGNVYAGWMIGSAIGGAYSASQQVIPGPKIGDVSQQTSQEGVSRPIIFGRSHPIAGNIICDGGPRIVKRRESQGKGGPKVESESAYRTYAVGVCEGPISAFLQVWKNNQLVYDIEDPGMAADNADFLRYARFFLGDYTQMPSPDLEAIKGVGNVSAHRGSAYMVLKDEDVTDQRGMWSQWTFRVFKGQSITEGLWWATPFPELSDSSRFVSYAGSNLEFSPAEERPSPGVALGARPISGSYAVRTPADTVILHGSNRFVEVYFSDESEAPIIVPTCSNSSAYLSKIRVHNGRCIAIFNNLSTYSVSEDGGLTWNEYSAPDGLLVGDICYTYTGTWSLFVHNDGPDQRFYHSDSDTPIGWSLSDSSSFPNFGRNTSIYKSNGYIIAPGTNGRVLRSINAYEWADSDVGVIGESCTYGNSNDDVCVVFSQSSASVYYSIDGGLTFTNPDTAVVPGSSDIYVSCAFGGGVCILSSGERSTSTPIYAFENDLDTWFELVDVPASPVIETGWIIAYVQSGANYKESFYGLKNIVDDIAFRCGAGNNIDTSDLQDKFVRGYTITNQYPAYGALQTLSQAFFFDPTNISGRVKFVMRGGDSVETITQDNMFEDGDQPIEETRRDTLSIPRVLHLNYYDVQGGLNTDKQISERPEEPRANGEQSIQTPVVLSANEAASVVAINHGAMAEMQKGELNFTLPDSFLRLTESDPIIVQWDGKSVRGVIAKVETDDGEQRYKVYRDRQSLYTLEVEGIPAAPVSPTPSRIAGPTLLQLIDIPILRDSDDRLGFYIAVSGVRPAWQGAFVEASFDGGETYEDGQRITSPSIIGSLSEPLGDHPQAFPDYVNTATVIVQSEGGVLSDSTLAGMMNRRNLAVIGDEIVNFSSVDEIEEGTWEVSNFLRGRKGTETQEHEAGTRFVLLDGAIFVPADLVLMNRTITFRATTFGRPVDEATIVNFTFTGESQRERAPAYLQAYKDGSDAVISWQGVGRLGGGVNVAMGASFAGYRVTITDGATTQEFDTLAQSFTTSIAAFTGELTISVQQRNSLTGLGPAIQTNMAA